MNTIKNRIALGEDSKNQFKEKIHNAEQLAKEITAFANALGGIIYIGVSDNGEIKGIEQKNLRVIEGHIASASAEGVVPPINIQTENVEIEGKLLILVHVPEGVRKPYHTRQGEYLTKSGAVKRVLSPEELQRMSYKPSVLFEEVAINDTSIETDFNRLSFLEYFEKEYKADFESYLEKYKLSLNQILNNVKIAEGENLNLVGLSFFGNNPQRVKPLNVIKAISFYGNDITDTRYISSNDIDGTLPEQFEQGMRFIQQNLLNTQVGKDFNSLGEIEIPVEVFEELLVNALVHRDYSILSAIRLFIFKDRIEIISPGVLPNHLNEENIRLGISIARNPILLHYASRLMPYRGVGSGILRALSKYPHIDFENNQLKYEFKVTIWRNSGIG
jgi:ATP-dependent DNA helicase RecG